MTDHQKKKMSHDEYLKAKGLWLLAKEARQECERYERALERLTQTEPGGHIGDSIWSDDGTLEIALERSGIDVEDRTND